MTDMSAPLLPVLSIKKGAKVTFAGRDYVVLVALTMSSVLAREVVSGEKVTLNIGDLGPAEVLRRHRKSAGPAQVALEEVSEHDWDIANARLQAIERFFSDAPLPKGAHQTAASELDVSVATVYRLIADYSSSGMLSSLLPHRPDGGKGRGRVSEEVEHIMNVLIQTKFLTSQKPSITKLVMDIKEVCYTAGLEPPARNTVKNRIDWIEERERVKRRDGENAARRFQAHKGKIPDADWPLAVVQMDHTLLPVIVVDDDHRKPINRCWITVMIDVYSRMCVGFYLSLDPPSAMSAGLCMVHAILKKERWMAKHHLADYSWDCWGLMNILHMDNAREFRGKMIQNAAKEYKIDVHLRPVKQPHYGAHIERLMGTLTQELKSVKGATFSGVKEKGEYDAEGNACMTVSETEEWLAVVFTQYHERLHSGIDTRPALKWKQGILGTKATPGRGYPDIVRDEEKLRMDLMPFEERAVHGWGVALESIKYYHDVLRPYMGSRDRVSGKLVQYKFRRDPRDISQLYFFDPHRKQYVSIPYRDVGLPVVSIWEYRAAQAEQKARGGPPDNTREVMELATRRRRREEDSAHKTVAARRQVQQRKEQAKARSAKASELPSVAQPATTAPPTQIKGYDKAAVRPLPDEY